MCIAAVPTLARFRVNLLGVVYVSVGTIAENKGMGILSQISSPLNETKLNIMMFSKLSIAVFLGFAASNSYAEEVVTRRLGRGGRGQSTAELKIKLTNISYRQPFSPFFIMTSDESVPDVVSVFSGTYKRQIATNEWLIDC